MKKVILLACVMVVSGFASDCSYDLKRLNQAIERYNKECTGDRPVSYYMIKSKCEGYKDEVREAEYKLQYCREKRNDDIARKFNSYR